jgi:hypothetical protein
LNVGFLTILQDATGGHLGGYLVTNQWGRPLEFRLSSAVQPNKVQQILYAGTLEAYLCADLIGHALVSKASVPVGLIVVDREAALDLRRKAECPVAFLSPGADTTGLAVSLPANRGFLHCHPAHPTDVAALRALLATLEGCLDLAEPFTRIREAIAEARKLGTGRAA